MAKLLARWKERLATPGLLRALGSKPPHLAAAGRRLLPLLPAVLAVAALLAADLWLVTNDAAWRGPRVEVTAPASPPELRRPAPPDVQGSTTAPQAAPQTVAAVERPEGEGLADLLPPLKGERLAAFGFQYNETYGDYRLHPGLDLAASTGTPVLAVQAGRVTGVRRDGPLGGQVTVSHAGGWRSVYANLGEILVREGAEVARGQMLGRVGDPGPAEQGPSHLHLELRRGDEAVDPLPYL